MNQGIALLEATEREGRALLGDSYALAKSVLVKMARAIYAEGVALLAAYPAVREVQIGLSVDYNADDKFWVPGIAVLRGDEPEDMEDLATNKRERSTLLGTERAIYRLVTHFSYFDNEIEGCRIARDTSFGAFWDGLTCGECPLSEQEL